MLFLLGRPTPLVASDRTVLEAIIFPWGQSRYMTDTEYRHSYDFYRRTVPAPH